MNTIRVRFAPSPTGNLHVGSARTAIFNWLFARSRGGTFVLRIEDTDLERSKEEYTASIVDGLRWLGVDWDEGPGVGGGFGPYFQSQRLRLYREAAGRLVVEGAAYPCFCSTERLDEMRLAQEAGGRQTRYDGLCRNLDPAGAQERVRAGERHLVRLKTDGGEAIEWADCCKGDISIHSDHLDDFVLVKSDGYPTYNFAVVVDDSGMAISHVIRGEDHISNTPKQILLYRAMGLPMPAFAHIPMILGSDRSKMSKRHGATNVVEYQKAGFLSDAFLNFMVLLGWAPGDNREIFTREELFEEFSLDRVTSHGAVFDMEKLRWMNQQYVKKLAPGPLFSACEPFLKAVPGYPGTYSRARLTDVVALFRERMATLAEIADRAAYFFNDPVEYEEKGVLAARKTPCVDAVLTELADWLAALEPFGHSEIEGVVRDLAERRKLGGGKIIHPARLAISGRAEGPGLFDLMEVVGRDTCVRRLRAFVQRRPWA